MIDHIVNSNFFCGFFPNTSLDSILIDRDLPVNLSVEDIQREIEQAESMLAKFYSNPQKYAKSIARFEEKVANLMAKKGYLASGGGDGKPPRQPTGIPVRDEYQKEKSDLVRYFSKDVVSSVLKTPQDEMYAAIAVRTLHALGLNLDTYEPNLPKDYKLEVLRRSGEFEFIFKKHPRFVRYVRPSSDTVLFRVMNMDHFKAGYNELGFKDYEDFFRKGIPCLNKQNTDYQAHLGMNGEREESKKTIYVATSVSKSGLFDTAFGHYKDFEVNYIFHIKPRGLNLLDAPKTDQNAELNALGPALLFEDERSFIGFIDPRDIEKVEIYQRDGKIKVVENKRYIRG